MIQIEGQVEYIKDKPVPVVMLYDTGCTSVFIDKDFAERNGITYSATRYRETIRLFGGHSQSVGYTDVDLILSPQIRSKR